VQWAACLGSCMQAAASDRAAHQERVRPAF
jgi:hypothetical protein